MTDNFNDILVVSDVDGTLLQAGYGIPKDNIDTIERFVAMGGRFTLATGRGIAAIDKYKDWVALSAPAILVNGGVIYDYTTKKVLHEYTLDPGVRTVLLEIMDVFPELGVEVLIREKCCALRMNETVLNHTAVEHIPFTLTDISIVADGWNKVLMADTPEMIQLVKEYAEKRCKHDDRFKKYDFIQTSKIYYEIIPKGVSKADGLKRLVEIMGMDIDKTVAIGDFYNDLELLDAAGVSAVVADAPDDVKEHANYIVASCLEGGVADMIAKIMQGEVFGKD